MPSLSSPLDLGDLRLRNRNIMSAMTRNRATHNVPNHIMADYYVQRASNAGLVVTEGTLISQQGTEWPNAPGIWNTDQITAWKKLVDAVHKVGGVIFCQLWHAGRLSHPDMPEQRASKKPVLAPSPIPARGGRFRHLPGSPGYVTPTPIADPWDLVLEYKNAAQNAKQAGFDGVELNASSGALPHQFLDSSANHRPDAWGGPPAARTRFPLAVVRALVEVWGCDRVGVKLSPAGGPGDLGMPLQETLDTYTLLVRGLELEKVLYVMLVRYVEALDVRIDGSPRGTPHNILDSYRTHLKRPYLFLNGGLSLPDAQDLLRRGLVDAVAFGRLWIAHPDLARRGTQLHPAATVDWPTVYGRGGDDKALRRGYTDYPLAPG